MAGAGFKTFNTGDVLTAADVNTYLMQQTVMVFASSAARSTALGANVAEGMLSYLKDTDQVEVYNGTSWVASDDPNAIQNTIVTTKGDLISATAASTPSRLASSAVNGDVLTVDTTTATGLKWAAPTSGGFTLLSTTTLATATTNITSINQTYNHLYIQMENCGIQTTNGAISMQLNSTTGNQRNIVYSSADATQYTVGTDIRLTQNRVVTIANNENVAAIWIYNYANTDTYKVVSFTSGWYDNVAAGYVVGFGHGLSSSISAISSVQFVTSAGTFNGGTIKIYGVK